MNGKRVSVSVTEFALPCPRQGSIEIYSGYGRAQQKGLELNQKIQALRKSAHANYRSEVQATHVFESEGFEFHVGGRMDGIFEREPAHIEEIKSTFNIYDLSKRIKHGGYDHPYSIQLKTYGYFHWLKTKSIPKLTLHLVSTRNGDSFDLEIKLDIESFETWLALRLAELVEVAKRAEHRSKRRKRAANDLKFPFVRPRAGQVDLIKEIEVGMKEKRQLLIQAPTGLGKTVGVLYPTLREALGRGQRVVYLTPKNSQHAVAEEAIERLQEQGAAIKAMTLTAKSKMCFKNEPICNPEYCEYAKDYYSKVALNQLPEKLAKKKKLNARTFKKMGEEFQVCPFELQIEAAPEADTIICDYNYVFAPRSVLGSLSTIALDQQGKPNLVIDEAHNIPARTLGYYSPELSTTTLESMRKDMQKLPKSFRTKAVNLLDDSIEVVKSTGPRGCQKPCEIDPPVHKFLEHDFDLREFLSTYLNSDTEIEPRDPILRLSFYWSEFTSALEFVSAGRKEFFTTFHPKPATVKITCCDAAEMLKACYDDYSNVVGFSATLKPFDYYGKLSGLSGPSLRTSEFTSPFPISRRKLLVIPQISSKYSERDRNYPRIAETIKKITALKRGNYFAFFPSFDFMERVLTALGPVEGFTILKQERSMSRDRIQENLDRLSIAGQAHIFFAVQGGVFSEGVDYPGDMAIGAFVVGPPLPNFDLEREKMREYYQTHYSAGFDYAYVYPAMAKSIQAAGRVIRSETDRGLIVLMDNRFVQTAYSKAMPQDWFKDEATELVSGQILQDVSQFWKSVE